MARILDVTPDQYHELEHFSASLAKELRAKSPLHAKHRRGKKPSKLLDRGAVIHRLVLGKGRDYVPVDANDWRTKDAKAERDAIRAQGLTPVLQSDLTEYSEAAVKMRAELERRGIKLDGESEVAVEWTDGDVLCKSMFDHVWMKRGLILDLKVTENANPTSVERTAENLGYAIQAAAYMRALTKLRPELAGRVDFLFAFCEPEAPWAVNICRPDGAFRELGERRWDHAVAAWSACLKTNIWPAYGQGVNPLSPPAWALNREDYAA